MTAVKWEIDAKQFKTFAVNVENTSKKFMESILKGMAKIATNGLISGAIMRGRQASNNLIEDIEYKKISNTEYHVTGPGYIVPLEEGSTPHWIPRNFRLIAFSNKVGIPIYVLQRSIAKKGTMPHPFTAEVLRNLSNEFREDIDRRLGVYFTSEAKTILN